MKAAAAPAGRPPARTMTLCFPSHLSHAAAAAARSSAAPLLRAARVRPARALAGTALLGFTLAFASASCGGSNGGASVAAPSFAPLDPVLDVLAQGEIDALVQAAALSSDAPLMAIAVCDRVGQPLRIWNRDPGSQLGDFDNKIALALARSAALASDSQTPLGSRAVQAAGSHHFPAQFDEASWALPFDPNSTVETQPTLGLANTAAAPFWQWDTSNRGAAIASLATNPPTAFAPGQALPQLANPDGSLPSPGYTPLPGGLPLYKRVQAALASPGSFAVERRLVGGIGVFARLPGTLDPDPAASEYAAWMATREIESASGEDYGFAGIPLAGAVYLNGVLLPYVGASAPPPGSGPGSFDSAQTVFDAGVDGSPDPFGELVLAHSSASSSAFADSEVEALIDACEDAALAVHSAMRLPASSSARVVLAVVDREGILLGLRRMEDAAIGAVDLAIAQARTARLYSDPAVVDEDGALQGLHPLFGLLPAGTAVSTRTLWFLAQPFFPPGIDDAASDIDTVPPFDAGSGPLYALACENRKPYRYDQLGFAPAAPIDPGVQDDSQNGLCFAPGGIPLYRDGALIGALGVAGDGPEVCDWIALHGVQAAALALGFELEPPPELRVEQYSYQGVPLPYLKLPANPGG